MEARRALFLATVAFAVSFAVWGLISGMAPIFKAELGLNATQGAVLVAVPVLLGSLMRIPLGLLTDRYGGRLVFSALLFFIVIPPLALAYTHTYHGLLFWGLWLGVAGASFAVGIGFVSRWYPPERQGFALGVYGAGNIGQSIAVFLAPRLAKTHGQATVFIVFAAAALAWAVVFALAARNAPAPGRPKTLADNLRVLRTQPLSWVFSLFYFLTFGGFVALGIYLPTLLKEVFALTPEDAGARTAGFVVLATACRPIGGWLSDRVPGEQVLRLVFAAIALLSLLLISRDMVPFTLGALSVAALLGLGNGAVFKLVPHYFPGETGTVTGLVGAAGGLGGFLPPLVLGIVKDELGSFTPGFVLLALFSLACLATNVAVFRKRRAVA